jgi:indolepyruvate ferredoxin oxidoreductase
VRGSWLDPFGRSAERRTERALAREYAATVEALLPALGPDNRAIAVDLARVPERIRGYGHVKLANLATARVRQRELLERYHGRAAAAPAATVIPIAVADEAA